MSRRRAGAIALVVLSALVYFAFTKHIPFTHGYRINAYFADAANIKPKSPVRIAGVDVGKVARVERAQGSSQVRVVMELSEGALPVHSDATANIRSRILLEGNNFIDLKPGSPSAPVLKDNGSLPAAQGSSPVQLDQVLGALNRDSRDGLASLFDEIGTALDTVGTPEENRTQDSDVAGLTGGAALNRSLRYAPEGFKGGAQIFDALIGDSSDDFTQIFKGFRDFNSAFNDRETQLISLLTDFSDTIGAFAADEQALTRSTREFSRLAIESEPTLRELNVLLPRIERFAREIAPSLGELPETVRLAYPWIEQTTQLLGGDELGRSAALSRPTFRDLAGLARESNKTLPQLTRIARCWTDVWERTMVAAIDDGIHSTGKANYKQFFYSLVGMVGESQNFNANGPYLRLGAGSAAEVTAPGGTRYGRIARPPLGNRPALPAKDAEIRDDVDCYKNAPPNLAPTSGSAP